MKVLQYLIWIVCIAVALVATSTIIGSLIGFDSVGVKGFTAGAGIAVFYLKRKIFALVNRIFARRSN